MYCTVSIAIVLASSHTVGLSPKATHQTLTQNINTNDIIIHVIIIIIIKKCVKYISFTVWLLELGNFEKSYPIRMLKECTDLDVAIVQINQYHWRIQNNSSITKLETQHKCAQIVADLCMPLFDWLVLIPNYCAFEWFQFSSCKMSFPARLFEWNLIKLRKFAVKNSVDRKCIHCT